MPIGEIRGFPDVGGKVVQLDPLLVVFAVPADYVRQLSTGQTIELRVASLDEALSGEIEFVSPTADPQSGTTRVRVRVPNPQERIPCGSACRLILPDEPRPSDKPRPSPGLAGR